MKKITESIERRFDAALKDAASHDEKRRYAGRCVCRQLAAVQGIIEEQIVCCKDCISFEPLDQLVREGRITAVEAEAERHLGRTGMCETNLTEKFVRDYDYCSDGVREVLR